FVDLPNQNEREAIWAIQIRNYGRNPSDFDLVQLARVTKGLTGSEIESVFADVNGKTPADTMKLFVRVREHLGLQDGLNWDNISYFAQLPQQQPVLAQSAR
ncbi:MAG TPA: hypothetical protein VHZ30_05020, partial [Verrucomicrobiae bacterium]|nr:hypothetical protein [Verrucomicrobiae bacterium]